MDPNRSDNHTYKFSYCTVKDHQCADSNFGGIKAICEGDHQNNVYNLVAIYSFSDVNFEDLKETDSFLADGYLEEIMKLGIIVQMCMMMMP